MPLFSCLLWLLRFRKDAKAGNPSLETACQEITIPGVLPWAVLRQPLHSHASLTIGSFPCLFPQEHLPCSFSPRSCLMASRWPRAALTEISGWNDVLCQGCLYLDKVSAFWILLWEWRDRKASAASHMGCWGERTFDIRTLFSVFSQLFTGKNRNFWIIQQCGRQEEGFFCLEFEHVNHWGPSLLPR